MLRRAQLTHWNIVEKSNDHQGFFFLFGTKSNQAVYTRPGPGVLTMVSVFPHKDIGGLDDARPAHDMRHALLVTETRRAGSRSVGPLARSRDVTVILPTHLKGIVVGRIGHHIPRVTQPTGAVAVVGTRCAGARFASISISAAAGCGP